MKINYKKSDIFIPEWEGNKDLPDNEQIKFHHRFLTTEERMRFVYWEPYTQGQIATLMVYSNVEGMTEDEAEKAVAKANRRYVQNSAGIAKVITTKIENLIMIDETGHEFVIDTIDKFYKCIDAFAALRAEYEQYCLNLSAKVETKNS